ncbi:MAG: hypothetical protein KF787_11475 [Phycisphaeraceae bacterium]|nr:hypothetical protein [Phycisphaerae bacterium]MBX3393255.1 hypothetical protein [Phycisphaeraceae bacterium]
MPRGIGPGEMLVWCFLAVLAVVVVAWPAGHGVREIAAGLMDEGRVAATAYQPPITLRPGLVASTLGWAIGIGACSTALAWPAAWAFRRHGAVVLPWIAAAMTMPSYLAYAGYGLVRSPGTWLGDWLSGMAQQGWHWAPIVAGKALAFAGLSLWSWPIPALVMGWAVSRVDSGVLDAMAMDRIGPFRRAAMLARILARPLASSVGIVSLVMIGSAVPLHLAQADTWSIALWFALDLTPWDSRWRVWLLAAPVMGIAAAAGWRVAAWAGRGSEMPEWCPPDRRGGRASTWLTILVWLLATVAPVALFAWSLNRWGSLATFWIVNADAVGWSAAVWVTTGAIGAATCAAVWMLGSSGRGAWFTRVVVASLVAIGLSPGVVVGALVNQAWSSREWTRPIADSFAIVTLAHLARFAWVPALIGCLLAGAEPEERRRQRRLDGATGWRGWWLACGAPGAGMIVSAGVLTGLLSMHEIESTVMVQPPGIDSLSRRILQFLHFSRMEDLSAAGVWLVGGGLVLACLAAGVLALTARRDDTGSPPSGT